MAPLAFANSQAAAFSEKPQQIADLADVVSVRRGVLETIWGPGGGWPVTNRATLRTSFDMTNPADAASLAGRGIPSNGFMAGSFRFAQELAVAVSIGGHAHQTWAYHLLPTAPANGRLMIVHHGHGDSFATAAYRLAPTLARFLHSGYGVLAMYQPNYGPAPRRPAFVDGQQHNVIFAEHGQSPTALRIFLEPIAACINRLRETHRYLDINMAGLSGGGWTTALYAAIDPSIRVSAPISGSLPLDLRTGGSVGDGEQMLPALFVNVAGYRDLYTLGAFGYGRKSVQIGYLLDSCCFSDQQWDPFHPGDAGGLGREMAAYRGNIRGRLSLPLAGDFTTARYSDNGGAHTVSTVALERVHAEVGSHPPRSSALFFYDSSGIGARAVLQANGHYRYVAAVPGLATGWTAIAATKNQNLLFYRQSDGRASTARLTNAGTYRYVALASGVGPGWTHVTAVGSQYVFLYDKAQGRGKVGRIDATTGLYSNVGAVVTGFSTQWTHIAGAANGGLLLFDAAGGIGFTASVGAGGYSSGTQLNGFAQTWTHLTTVNANALFFYNAATGTGATALLDAAGSYVYTGLVGGGLPRGASLVAGAKNGGLFFYKGSAATGAAWFTNELGETRPIEGLSGFRAWTHVTGG